MTPAGIEPAIFRFVAQHLNHCVTAAPYRCICGHKNCLLTSSCLSALLSTCISSASTGQIFYEICSWRLLWRSVKKIQIWLKLGTFTWRLSTYVLKDLNNATYLPNYNESCADGTFNYCQLLQSINTRGCSTLTFIQPCSVILFL